MNGLLSVLLLCMLGLAQLGRADTALEQTLDSLGFEDHVSTFQTLKSNADAGSPEAQLFVSDFYLNGVVVPKNERIAFSYVSRSAEAGFPPAIGHLANFYLNGWSVAKDMERAVTLLEQADTLKVAEASATLSGIYISNNNGELAYKYARRAVRLQSPHGALNLGVIYLYGIEPNSKPSSDWDLESALYWIEMAGHAGSPEACMLLGQLYSSREFPRTSFKKALFWSSLAEKMGVEDAKAIKLQSELNVGQGARNHVAQQLDDWKPKPVAWDRLAP